MSYLVILKYCSSDHAAVILQQRNAIVEKIDRAARGRKAPLHLRRVGLPRLAREAVARRARYRRRRGNTNLGVLLLAIIPLLWRPNPTRVLPPEHAATTRKGSSNGTQTPQRQQPAPLRARCSLDAFV